MRRPSKHPGGNRCPCGSIRRFLGRLLSVGLLLGRLATATQAAGAKDEFTPDEIKAGILSKMLAYSINWPTNSLSPISTNLLVGVVGPDPIEKPLAVLLKDRKVAGRDVQVTQITDTNGLARVQVVFVPTGQQARWMELKRSVVESGPLYGVLAVGERDDFLTAGGVIALFSEERKYKIDKGNARKAGLKLDSRLLDLERKMWAATQR